MRLLAPALLLILLGFTRVALPRDSAAERAGLALAGLAAVPAAATDVHSEAVRNKAADDAFPRSYAIEFSASAADIEQFLKSSPRLSGVPPEQLSEQHQYIPYVETIGNEAALRNNAVFRTRQEFPWFVPAVRAKGRRYVLPQDKKAVGGEVVVDDANGTVYVLIDRS
jgi:hypothetical protein